MYLFFVPKYLLALVISRVQNLAPKHEYQEDQQLRFRLARHSILPNRSPEDEARVRNLEGEDVNPPLQDRMTSVKPLLMQLISHDITYLQLLLVAAAMVASKCDRV